MFITITTLEIGVYSALLQFNDGACGISQVMEKLGMNCNKLQLKCYQRDEKRISAMCRKSSVKVKQRRKEVLHARKGFVDKDRE